MSIRLLKTEELDEALVIYENARAFMRRIGNVNQWKDNWPPVEVLRDDIVKHRLYGVFHDDVLAGVFVYWYGEHAESTYNVIYDGAWQCDRPYGVVHRIAAAEGSGAGKEAIRWAIRSANGHLRMDTHEDNAAMRHVLESLGFHQCGIILLTNGDPRIAFEIAEQ